MMPTPYIKSIELLHRCSSSEGFLASAENITNYKRVWARDGVICGLAALASCDDQLITTFKSTLETLANNQHANGTIPSNVMVSAENKEVSYGGLAGRVDAVSWFVIGICQYAFYKNDTAFITKYESHIQKCLQLLEAWEFNIDKNHNQFKIIEVHNQLMIHATNMHTINLKYKQVVPMYTSMDLMKELEYQVDKVFTLIVKSLHLIINMLNHVGPEVATR